MTTASSVSPVGRESEYSMVAGEADDLDRQLREKPVEFLLGISPRPGVHHDCGLKVGRRIHQASLCGSYRCYETSDPRRTRRYVSVPSRAGPTQAVNTGSGPV